MRPLRTLLVPLAALALSCGESAPVGRPYRFNDLQLITAYQAKETCSCVFVMEQPEDFCQRWTHANPAVAKTHVDRQARTVEASAVLLWGARARFVDERTGCVLE